MSAKTGNMHHNPGEMMNAGHYHGDNMFEAPGMQFDGESPPVEGKRARAQQQVWKSHEVELLQQGVARYGRNWKAILDDGDFAPTLGGRSAGSLKLKWYKMSKEHEEKMTANSRIWGLHSSNMQAGPSLGNIMNLEGGIMGGLGNPFGTSFVDGYGGADAIPGENAMFDVFQPDEIRALKESTARYGPNWQVILMDPVYAVPLMNRSPAALQMFWNQLQDMPKPSSVFDLGGPPPPPPQQLQSQQLSGHGSDLDQDDCSEGGDGIREGFNATLQSMRSWGRLETDALVKGFEIYGTDWKAILLDQRYRPHLSHRTAHSLKSKWARMMKKRKRDDERQYGAHSPTLGGFHNGDMVGVSAVLGGASTALSDCFANQFNPLMHTIDDGGVQPSLQAPVDPAENYDKSIEEYTKEIGQNPSNPVLYNHRGVVYYAKGLVDQALEDFSTAIALDCSYADAFTNRGMAFNSKGEFDLAIMDCTTTIDINPTSSSATNAFLTRALTHYNKGMLEKCIADCEATLALRPRCVSALVTRGLTVLAQTKVGQKTRGEMINSYESALRDFKDAMSIDPNNAQARVWHDEAMMLLNDPNLHAENRMHSMGPLLGDHNIDEEQSSPINSDTLASRFMH